MRISDWSSDVCSSDLAAEAGRKFIAIGTISDYGGTTASVYSRVARAALDVADHVLFVGPMATHALRAKTPEPGVRPHAFATVKDAANFLATLPPRALGRAHVGTPVTNAHLV